MDKRRLFILALGFLIILAFAFKIYFRPDVHLTDPVSVITCGILLLTLYYTAIAFEIGEIKSKDTLSFNTACDWHKPIMTDCQKMEKRFMSQYANIANEQAAKDFYEELEKESNIEYKTAIFSILNYFESISLGVKKGILNEKFIKGFFYSLFKSYYNEYAFYINYRRYKKNNDRLWNNFSELFQKWNKS